MADVREKLVELLGDALNSVDWDSSDYPDTNSVADIMIANGVTTQRWIPVTERLPEEFVSVLIYAPGMAPMPTVMEAYWASDCWATKVMILQEHEVTHWMEMPEAPGDCHGLRPRNDVHDCALNILI